MFNDDVKLQRFPLAILIFSPLFSLKSGCYAYLEISQPLNFSHHLTLLHNIIIFPYHPPLSQTAKTLSQDASGTRPKGLCCPQASQSIEGKQNEKYICHIALFHRCFVVPGRSCSKKAGGILNSKTCASAPSH